MDEYEIPCTKAVPSAAFASAEGSVVEVSSLGLTLDARALFEELLDENAFDMATDPVNVRSIVVKLEGSDAYTVFDRGANLGNTLSACGFDASLSVAFNRPVDPAQIDCVEVSVTDAADMDDLLDAQGSWPAEDAWPTRVVV